MEREKAYLSGVKLLVARNHAAVSGLLAAGADQQQIGVKQARLAFAQTGGDGFSAPVAIAQQLLERRVDQVGRSGVADLRLHHQRDVPFTNSTMLGMMHCFTQPGVSMRNWLMA